MAEKETENKEIKENKKPDWVKMKPAELEKIVIELYKQGETPAKIGLILRDKHGVPKAKLIGKKIMKILSEANIEIKSDRERVEKHIGALSKHLEKNKHDKNAKKALTKQTWALNKIIKSL